MKVVPEPLANQVIAPRQMALEHGDLALIPLRTFQRRVAGNADVRTILVSVREGASTDRVKADIEQLLRERRHVSAGEDDNFYVMDMKEISRTLAGTTQILTALLGAVAAVSLLVGGIGIIRNSPYLPDYARPVTSIDRRATFGEHT